MMENLDYHTLRSFAASFGLIFMVGGFGLVLVYSFWPGSGKRFDSHARSLFEDEEGVGTNVKTSPHQTPLVKSVTESEAITFPSGGCCHG